VNKLIVEKKKLEEKEKRLKKKSRKIILFLSVLALVLGLLFWSVEITGRVVLSNYTSNSVAIGAFCLVLSVVGFYFYVRLIN
jgi:putative Mn2+ efflux pump MntP